MASGPFEGLFAEFSARIDAEFEKAVSLRLTRECRLLRREIAERFHQAARQFRQCETRQDLYALLADSCAAFCDRAILLEVHGGTLVFAGGPTEKEVSLNSAPAVAAVVQSDDAVVALCSTGELSAPLAAALGGAPKAYLFPLRRRSETLAVLCAAGENVDAAALELLAWLAGAVIEARVAPPEAPSALVTIGGVTAAKPSWFDLPGEERRIHLRAQRVARVRTAEMMLHRYHAVRAGRESSDLYSALRNEIDSAREMFRRQFFAACPSMVDYLHLEFIRTLANDDEALLGPEYPGPIA